MEIKCLESIYREKEILNKETGNIEYVQIPVKLNFVTKVRVEAEDILLVKEHYNDKGRIYKDRCLVHHRYLGNIIVKHTYKEMVNIKAKNNFTVKGFYGKLR